MGNGKPPHALVILIDLAHLKLTPLISDFIKAQERYDSGAHQGTEGQALPHRTWVGMGFSIVRLRLVELWGRLLPNMMEGRHACQHPRIQVFA